MEIPLDLDTLYEGMLLFSSLTEETERCEELSTSNHEFNDTNVSASKRSKKKDSKPKKNQMNLVSNEGRKLFVYQDNISPKYNVNSIDISEPVVFKAYKNKSISHTSETKTEQFSRHVSPKKRYCKFFLT